MASPLLASGAAHAAAGVTDVLLCKFGLENSGTPLLSSPGAPRKSTLLECQASRPHLPTKIIHRVYPAL